MTAARGLAGDINGTSVSTRRPGPGILKLNPLGERRSVALVVGGRGGDYLREFQGGGFK